MGEVGFSRNEFLYELKWWEIRATIDGYRKRERTFCVMTRWSTFMQMLTGMADMKSAGIYSAEDLATFPWEKKERSIDLPNNEEVLRMRKELQEENAKRVSSTT